MGPFRRSLLVGLTFACYVATGPFSACSAFAPPIMGIGAVLFPVRTRIVGVSEDPLNHIRTSLQDASDFFVDSFWTGKIGGGARYLTDRQRRSLEQSQLAEFTKRYGGRRQDAELLVCRNENNEIIACAGVEVDTIPEDGIRGRALTRAPLISNVAVSQAYRRRGLAEQLVVAVEDACKDWGYDECFLFVEQRNRPAINLYRKMGYRPMWVDDTAKTMIPTDDGALINSPTVMVCMRKDLFASRFGNLSFNSFRDLIDYRDPTRSWY